MNHFFTSDWHVHHNNILNYAGRLCFMTNEEKEATKLAHEDAVANHGGSVRMRVQYSKETMDRMHQAFIDNTNEIVGKNDILWYVGDLSHGMRCPADEFFEKIMDIRSKINCKTINLVWGNHDQRLDWNNVHNRTMKDWKRNKTISEFQFYKIFNKSCIRIKIKVNGQKIVLDHYAQLSWDGGPRGVWQLYGHSHGNLEEWRMKILLKSKQFDIGVDARQKIIDNQWNSKPEHYRPWTFAELKSVMDARSGMAVDVSSPGYF